MADDDELLAELELTGANDVDEQFSSSCGYKRRRYDGINISECA